MKPSKVVLEGNVQNLSTSKTSYPVTCIVFVIVVIGRSFCMFHFFKNTDHNGLFEIFSEIKECMRTMNA